MEQRQLIFRGKSLDTAEWVYGYGVVQCTEHNEARIFNQTGGNMMHSWAVDINTLGQYTNVDDRHGIKVFDGDRLTFGKSETEYTVVWHKDKWLAISKDGDKYGAYTHNIYNNTGYSQEKEKLTIIGNIHEYPKDKT